MTRYLFWMVKFSIIYKGNKEECSLFKQLVEGRINEALSKVEKETGMNPRSLRIEVVDTE